MHRLFSVLVLLFGLAIGSLSVAAQSNTTRVNLPDVLVICPGDDVRTLDRENAQFVIEFNSETAVLTVPIGRVVETEAGRVLEIGDITLTCESDSAAVAQIDHTPGVPTAGQNPPRATNPDGLAESQAGYVIVIGDPANLRSCPSPRCTRVGVAGTSEELIVIGRNEGASWWYVQLGELRGWVWSDLVAVRGTLASTPIVETDVELTQPTVYIGFTGNPIYGVLRAGEPSLCPVQGGQEYAWLGRDPDTSWVYIEAQCVDGAMVTGWINIDNVAPRNTGSVVIPVLTADGIRR